MSDPLIVNTSFGALRGLLSTTLSGREFLSFQGVPYASPPVGAFRFKEPQPMTPWSGVRDATKEGSVCAQSDLFIQQKMYLGNEDCLFLNLYRPKMPIGVLSLLPVMVWIHGGGYFSGSSTTDVYGPNYLIEQDVILVTINYRLGVLGFLCLETPEIPGNAGLKDMVMALKWIQNNVEKFGGDSNNVTIFGQSAGGAAVQLLMISPMAKGLFHKAIAQSGSCLNQWAYLDDNIKPINNAIKLTELLGKKQTDPSIILEQLRNEPAEKLIKLAQIVATVEDKKRDSAFPFAPVIEKSVDGENSFLTGHPFDLIRDGNVFDVPFMTGYTDKEGVIWEVGALGDEKYFTNFNDDFQYFVPLDFGYSWNSTESIEIAAKIRKFYFAGEKLSVNSIDKYFDLMTDFAFFYKIINGSKMFVAKQKSPLYFYKFSHDGDLNFFKKHRGLISNGTCHEDDLGYIFRTKIVNLKTENGSASDMVRKKVVHMWTNFAKYGNPTPEITNIVNVKWNPVTKTDMNYLEISADMNMLRDPDHDREQFWDNLYKTHKKL